MIFLKTKISGVYIIEPKLFEDNRGKFIKTYNREIFVNEKLTFVLKENYYSVSRKNVIRGMHFQVPPKEHAKLVYVTRGKILDVVLDIRKGSSTYGEYITVELSDENCKAIYIPIGCAHGFLSLKNDSTVIYLQTSPYSKKHDKGIKYNSFGMQWKIKKPVLSERDLNFPSLHKFISPFKI